MPSAVTQYNYYIYFRKKCPLRNCFYGIKVLYPVLREEFYHAVLYILIINFNMMSGYNFFLVFVMFLFMVSNIDREYYKYVFKYMHKVMSIWNYIIQWEPHHSHHTRPRYKGRDRVNSLQNVIALVNTKIMIKLFYMYVHQ